MALQKKITLFFLLIISYSSIRAQEYFSQLAADGVEIMAMVKYGMLDYDYRIRMAQGLYELNYSSQFQPDKDSPLMLCQPGGGAAYYDGYLYVNEYDDTGQIHKQKPHWRVYETTYWEMISDIELPDNCEATTTSLTYDPTTNMVYGFLSTYTETFFVSVNPKTGEITRIGSKLPYANKYSCIACNRKGQLYCIYFDKESSVHFLAKIRKADGKVANIGTMTITNLLDGDSFVDGGYAQSLFFNNATGKLYWIYQSSTENLVRDEYTALMEINIQTGEASLSAYLLDALLIPCAYFNEPSFTSPASITDFSFNPITDDRLTATLNFRLPDTDYVGDPIDGDLQVFVIEEGDTIAQGVGNNGTIFTTPQRSFTLGMHEVSINVKNAEGKSSPIVKQKFYAGYDTPAACQNIRLTADNLTTTLTWEAPINGMNNAPINTEDYTYTVIRYPYEVTVAENLKGFSFSEEHLSDMTRYVYAVKAIDSYGREGKSSFSNNLIVGTPLSVPYGGIFEEAADMINYYTIIDRNEDGYSWSYDTSNNSAVYEYNTDEDADDWLISPPIIYEKGQTYELNFTAFSSNEDYPEALEVRCGTDRDPANHTTLLLSIPEVPYAKDITSGTNYTVKFTSPVDGLYHYSFRATSPAYSYNLYLYNISINKEGAAEINNAEIENSISDTFDIYNVSGKIVSLKATKEYIQKLPSGIYLIKSGSRTSKIIK